MEHILLIRVIKSIALRLGSHLVRSGFTLMYYKTVNLIALGNFTRLNQNTLYAFHRYRKSHIFSLPAIYHGCLMSF